MFIRDLNQQGQTKIDKINKLLKEEFGMSIKSKYPEKAKLENILEMYLVLENREKLEHS